MTDRTDSSAAPCTVCEGVKDEVATVEQARKRQAEIVAIVRERGFKNGGEGFTDAQVWQAVMDSRDWCGHYWDCAAGKLLEHVIEKRVPPSSPTYAEAP